MLFSSLAPQQSASGGRPPPRALPILLVSGVLSGWTLVGADARQRAFAYFSVREHVLGSLGLYAAVGALLGLLVLGLIAVERRLVARTPTHSTRRELARRAGFYGVVGGLASVSTAIWTFSGEKVQETPLAVLGPVLFASFFGCVAAVGAALSMLALEHVERGRPGWLVIAVAAFAIGGGIAHVDLTQFVALYSRVHTILELVAALCLGAAYALALTRLSRNALPRRLVGFSGLLAGTWLAAVVAVPGVRVWLDQALRHVWLDEVYIGRMLRRVQVADAFFSNPFEWRGMHMARIERLKTRYSLSDLSLLPAWNQPLAESPEHWDALRALRGGQNRYNVVIYYVDTLRADVASDAATMPAVARFRAGALDFKRAYATGSDTLRSLPAMTGGNYDVFRTPPNDLLRVVKHADYDDGLVIAKSAYEFLGKLRPEFYFTKNLVIEDYPAEQQVWGYGAQRPTGPALVDRALGFLDERRNRPFFLWLFNFDQHNWRELDNEYIDENARKFGITDDPALLPYRYRVVARSIDNEFDRLIQALAARKLLDSTIVLFVSDHGEALGRDGFWVHSVFLWESLIRVPLVLRVPGLQPQTIDTKVSLVDVAPTLGRYVDPTLDGRGFQGEDLLGHLLPKRPPRRFPLLLLGASKDLLVRIGVVDPVDEFKLILSFEAALPELYDLRIPDPDAANFASKYPDRTRRTLRQLVRSPVFPRTPDDFEVRDTKEQKALSAAEGN